MLQVNQKDIKIRISEYLSGRIDLSELNDWVASHAWDIDDSTDPIAANLLYSAELRIAEYDGGYLGRSDFRELLKELAIGALKVTKTSSSKKKKVGTDPTPFESGGIGYTAESSSRLVGSI